MKHYTVEITNEALADMEQLYNHIAYVLQAPKCDGSIQPDCRRYFDIGYYG